MTEITDLVAARRLRQQQQEARAVSEAVACAAADPFHATRVAIAESFWLTEQRIMAAHGLPVSYMDRAARIKANDNRASSYTETA
jgi:hypothetical protein